MDEVKIDKEIDARGSFCPGPLMELVRNLKGAQVGQVLAVLSSDAGSAKDIPAWVEKAGHELVRIDEMEAGVRRFVVRKRR
jgi:tRNA 2-thiouridine synthesizing protein A